MKTLILACMVAMLFVIGSTLPASAMGGSRGRSGVEAHPEVLGHHGFHEHPGVRERHEFFERNGFRWHHQTEIFVAPGFLGSPDWWGPGAPSYAEPPGYVQPELQPHYYWYYCKNPPAYYPYVKQCPGGWQTVVPFPSPQAE